MGTIQKIMPDKTYTSLNQVVRRLRAINLWHLALITILAEIVTAVMNTIMGIRWWGQISYDLIIIGTIDAFVASIVVGTIILYIIDRLHETDEHFRSIIETSREWIWAIDAGGRHTYSNPAVHDILGYHPEEIIGKDALSFLQEEDRLTLREMLPALFLQSQGWSGLTLRWMHKNGSVRYLESFAVPILNRSGTTTGFRGTDRDITERVKAEALLRENETQLQALSHNLAEGMVYQINSGPDGSTRRFTYLSPAVEHLHGLTVDEVLNNPLLLYEQVVEEQRAYLAEQESHAYTQRKRLDIDVMVRLPSQELRWRRFTSSPRLCSDGSLLWDGIEIDITDKKMAEEQLQRSEMQLKESQVVAKIGSWQWDLLNNSLQWSDETFRRFDKDPSTFKPTVEYFIDRIHPDDRGAVQSAIKEVLEQNKSYAMRHRTVNETGREWVMEGFGVVERNAEGIPIRFSGTAQDITERRTIEAELERYSTKLQGLVDRRTAELKETIDKLEHEIAVRETAELAVRESEERFREIFEQNGEPLLLLDCSTRTVIDANPAAVDTFGYSRQDFIAKGITLIFMPAEYEQINAELQTIETTGGFRIPQMKSATENGTAIVVSFWGKTVRLKKNTVLLCSLRNISARIRLEEEAKILHTKLIQNDKMISLGMLVSGIAHEINNPNHYIMANAQMVSEVWKDAARVLSDYYQEHGDFQLGGAPYSEMQYVVPHLFTGMVEGSGRIKGIVDNLKDFSRQGRTGLDMAVDINTVITASAELMGGQIKTFTDRFILRKGIDLPPAKGNKQQLEQVVINLLMNALQSLRDRSGSVILSTSFNKVEGRILIQVEDEGVGMTEELLSHVTEPFFTTRIDRDGTGLGLSISDAIIRDHQGALAFRSEPGKGTSVTVSLPQYHDAAERNRHANDRIS